MDLRADLPVGLVTLVFTDIEGSTRLLHDLGDRYGEVLTDHRRLLREAFAAGGGVEVDTQGDAFFVAFPDAALALDAVAAAQRALAAHAWPCAASVRVRVGVHTGSPGRTDEGYVGLALHQGARVMGAAHGEQVVVSAATRAAAGSLNGLEFLDLGEHRLKDLSEPQRLYQLAGPGLRRDFPPLKTLGGYYTNLPAQHSHVVGRGRELSEVAELLRTHRLVTLTGPGGTGKTRLGLQAAADALDGFPAGVFFCDLAVLGDADLVATTIGRVLGVRERTGESSEDAVRGYIADRSLLLVLDNFEHVLDAARMLARLLRACPNLRVVATSRAPLRISGEREYAVDSLPLADAVALFEQRAAWIGEDASAHDDSRSVSEAICEQLDRLPLAIELAAARLRALSREQVLTRLQQRLSLLTGGSRDAPDRQRTLRATLDWSYELLDAGEQQLLSRLGVFASGFTSEAAEQVCAAGNDVIDRLEQLVEQSLVRHSAGRYSMLEIVREYALEKLELAGELDDARSRHAEWALTLLASADPRDDERYEPAFVYSLRSELDNLRQAMSLLIERKPAEMGRRVLAICFAWVYGARTKEGLAIVRAVEAAQVTPSDRVVARIGASLGFLGWTLGDSKTVLRGATSGIAAGERADDAWGLIVALCARSWVAYLEDEPAPDRWGERALVLARERQQPHAISMSLALLGFVQSDQAAERARGYFEEIVALFPNHDYGGIEAFAIYNLGCLDLDAGRYDEAARVMAGVLRSTLDDPRPKPYATRGLGAALAGRRAHHDAARLIGAADTEIARLGQFDHPSEAAQRAAAIARIEGVIGRPETEAALVEGSRMQIAKAVELALSLISAERDG